MMAKNGEKMLNFSYVSIVFLVLQCVILCVVSEKQDFEYHFLGNEFNIIKLSCEADSSVLEMFINDTTHGLVIINLADNVAKRSDRTERNLFMRGNLKPDKPEPSTLEIIIPEYNSTIEQNFTCIINRGAHKETIVSLLVPTQKNAKSSQSTHAPSTSTVASSHGPVPTNKASGNREATSSILAVVIALAIVTFLFFLMVAVLLYCFCGPKKKNVVDKLYARVSSYVPEYRMSDQFYQSRELEYGYSPQRESEFLHRKFTGHVPPPLPASSPPPTTSSRHLYAVTVPYMVPQDAIDQESSGHRDFPTSDSAHVPPESPTCTIVSLALDEN